MHLKEWRIRDKRKIATGVDQIDLLLRILSFVDMLIGEEL